MIAGGSPDVPLKPVVVWTPTRGGFLVFIGDREPMLLSEAEAWGMAQAFLGGLRDLMVARSLGELPAFDRQEH
jgi:hypothetical protein